MPPDPSPPAGPPAHVTTFYSYKGGVGRSLLLANVGWLLAERRRVLLWDLDVEAPGLHKVPALAPPEVRRGFLEWLNDWERREKGSREPMTARQAADLAKLVLPVSGRPNLAILPAFADGADFARLYAEGPWRRLLVEEPALGLDLFHAVLAAIGRGRDHVLIDSRTGVTDVGGLLAALLPHATVLVGGYGHQSLHGLLHVKKALEVAAAGRLPPRDRLGAGSALELLQVVSPVPEDDEGAAERRRIWSEVFGESAPIEVPFDRRLLWSERLLAAEDSERAAGLAYAKVARRIDHARSRLLQSAESVAAAAARYPGEPRAEADDPRGRTRRGQTFEERVARLLELHNYAVEPKQLLGGNEVDLVARVRSGLDEQCWWVECKDHRKPVGKDVLEKLAGWVAGEEGRRQRARGMVVARAFSAAAVGYATDHPELRAWTVDDLERKLYDPRPALHSLVSAFEKSPLGRTYVRQRVLLEQRPEAEARADLLDHAHAWAAGEGARLWLLLGDFGTGKSAFFRRLAYDLARRALDDPEAPFPIAIDLKQTPNAASAETLLFEYLRRASPDFRGGPEVLLHLLASGRCVLLLDAFDEMGVVAAGRSIQDQFRELARLAGEEPLDPRRGNRVLITCRTHFFRDQQQVKATAAGRPAGLVAAEDSDLGRVARRFNAAIDELCLFDDEQIAEFLEKHLGAADAERAKEFITETYDLKTLAPRPVLLEMIVDSLPSLWKEAKETRITSAGLYEYYTRLWLEDKAGRNLQTPPELRHRLLAFLAASLWRRDDRQIHHRELLAEVERLAGHFPGIDHERVDIELRTAAFLVRSAEGYYRFSHKSFLEYFLARHLWQALDGEGAGGAALDLPPLTPEVGEFFWRLPDGGAEARVAALRAILAAPYRSRVSENALRLGAWSRKYLGAAFRVERAGLAGAQLAGADLRGVELPSADLTEAMLAGAQFEDAVLAGARLDRARSSRARAAGVDLSGASLAGARLAAADFSRAVLRGAVVDGADLSGAVLDRADLSAARLRGAILTGAWGHETSFEEARLERARLDASVWTGVGFRGAKLAGASTEGWLLAGCTGRSGGAAAPLLERFEAWVAPGGAHRGSVFSVALSSDGSVVASGGDDGSVRLWDGQSGAERAVLSGHQGTVWSVALSSDGSVVASGGDDGSVRLWDGQTGAERAVLSGHQDCVRAVALSSDGSVVASGGDDGSVRLWDGQCGAERAMLSGHQDCVRAVALSSDGSVVASGGDDSSVRLWDGQSGAERAVLSGHQGSVFSVALSSDGSVVASGGSDGSVRLWDGQSGAERAVLSGHQGSVFSVALSSDGSVVASGGDDGSVRLWDGQSGAERAVLSGHQGRVQAVALLSDGSVVASGGDDGSVRLWDGQSGAERALLSGRQGRVWSVALLSDGSVVASGGDDGSVRLWDGQTGAERAVLSGHQDRVWSVALSSDGSVVASGGHDGSVRLWDGQSGAERAVLSGHQGTVWSMALSSDGSVVASGGSDGSVRLWDGQSGAERAVLSGHQDTVWSVALSSDGSVVASGGHDGSVRLWDGQSGAERAVLSGHQGTVWSVALSSDGSVVASGGDDGSVRLWDGQTGAERAMLSGHQGRVQAVALSSDGSVVASGGHDGSVRLWDGQGGAERAVLSGHQGRVQAVALSSDGSGVASGGDDGSVRLWDGQTGAERARFTTELGLAVTSAPGGWFRVSPLGARLDPGLLRLQMAWGSPGSYRVLPLGGLYHLLDRPDHVAAVLAGAEPPPPPEIWTSPPPLAGS